MSIEENMQLVRRFSGVFNERDLAVLDEVLAPDFVAHNGDTDVRGIDGWKTFVTESQRESSEIETGIDELIANDNLVAERWRWRSVDRATGKPLVGHGITMHRVANGRLVENWAVFQVDSDTSA